MDHANIARVLDAGTTDTGRPYFVMDLVRGVPITRYCDEHHLTPKARLELFIPVCQAIQHAHQKGIIHRDLKPSNVLVALYDGKPVPKVIDFGVAKATGQSLTDKTLVTGFGNIVGTLEYMSPEQAEVNQLDIDTRSDIYSLGVLLYELLTGGPPFSRKELENAGMLEMLRVIREEEPTRPSTKLSTADGLPTLAANRGTEPAKLTKLVRGELDWIVMKALEKDRNRRYETANGFAMDVQRYLADEPVQACPPSAGYRFRKFARRNKTGLAVAGLVLFFLVLLGSGSGWVWRDRAARVSERTSHLERAVERAELHQREGKRGEALAALERAQLLAREAQPAPPLKERLESLQELLDAEGRDGAFVSRFEAIRREVQSEVDVEKSKFRSDNAYPKIREALEHYGIKVGVTPPVAAVAHIQQRPAAIAATIIAALDMGLDHRPREDSEVREWFIDVLQKADDDPWRNNVRRAWNQPATLEALSKDIDVRQQQPSFLLRVAGVLPISSPSRLDLLRRVQFASPGDFWANHELASELAHKGKHSEAIRYYTAALALRPDNPGVLLNRANALRAVGELEAAAADLQRAIAVAPRYAGAHTNLGIVLGEQKKVGEAVEAARKAVKLAPRESQGWQSLGWALYRAEDWKASLEALEKSCQLQPGGTGDCGQWVVMSLAHTRLAAQEGLLEKQREHHLAEARRRFDQADEDMFSWRGPPVGSNTRAIWDFRADAATLLGLPDPEQVSALIEQARSLRDQKKYPEAEFALREVIRLKPNLHQAQAMLGWTLQSQGKFPEMEAAFRDVLRLKPDHAGGYHGLGQALVRQKKSRDAIAPLREAVRLGSRDHWVYNALGWALVEQGEPAEAEAAFREVVRLKPDHAGGHHGLGRALVEQKKLRDAIAPFREAVRLDSKDHWVYDALGWALVEQGEPAEAEAAFREVVRLKPDHAHGHFGLGRALVEQKRYADAEQALRETLRINPTHPWANELLGRALIEQGKSAEAEELRQKSPQKVQESKTKEKPD
jgi:tetratricopeptide (TPR) repeat protein